MRRLERSGMRLCSLLLTLVLMLSLMPMQLAFASDADRPADGEHYNNGDPCPNCGYALEIVWSSDSEHFARCGFCGYKSYELHWGFDEHCLCAGCGHNCHNYDRFYPDINPTCTEPGEKRHWYCSRCQKHYGLGGIELSNGEWNIPALGHDWGDWTADPDDGTSHYRVCKREGCGATETEKHHADSYKYWSSSIHYVKCMVCLEKTLWASEPHTLGNWQDNGDGTHTGKCVCGMTQTVEHTYTWTYVDDDTHKGVCECGAQTTEAHSGGTATCTSGPICERCGKDYDKPLGHDWTGKIVWQWTEKAHYVSAFVHYTCQREGCGAYDNQDMHFEKVTNAACDAEGEIVYSVSLAANETLTGVAYTDEKRESISPLGHDLVNHDAQAATCTEVGWEAYDTCSRCDYSTYKEIAALGHDLIHHDAQAATCTEIGWEAYDTCSRCDYSTYKEIPALGHDLIHHDAQAATCTEVGWEAYNTCSRCDYSTYKEIEALGHDWGEWQVTTEPEVGKSGERQRICNRCNETEEEMIPALIGYSVTGGVDTSWTKGSSGSITITVNRSEDDESCFSHYVETLIDGNPVTVSAKAGSTVVTISADTLEKLSTGSHTITVKFDDGEVETGLTIKTASSSAEPTSPQTGDSSHIGLWFALMCLSIAGLITLLISSRKKKARS